MKILILFSTMMGTTEDVVKTIQKSLLAQGSHVDLCNVYDTSVLNFDGYDVLIFGSPTYDEGLEWGMEQFVRKNNPDLCKYNVAVFGVGDRMYPDYCVAADILEKWILSHSGKLCVPILRIEGYSIDVNMIEGWTKQIYDQVEKSL